MLWHGTATTSGQAVRIEEGDTTSMMPDQDAKIDFTAPATLKKWPSVNKERVSVALGARPYTIIAGTLDECIQKDFENNVASGFGVCFVHPCWPSPVIIRSFLTAC
jgi:hypothetical protein